MLAAAIRTSQTLQQMQVKRQRAQARYNSNDVSYNTQMMSLIILTQYKQKKQRPITYGHIEINPEEI